MHTSIETIGDMKRELGRLPTKGAPTGRHGDEQTSITAVQGDLLKATATFRIEIPTMLEVGERPDDNPDNPFRYTTINLGVFRKPNEHTEGRPAQVTYPVMRPGSGDTPREVKAATPEDIFYYHWETLCRGAGLIIAAYGTQTD